MAGDCGYKGKGRKGRSGMKKVSVIIPAYRCAATLRQAFDSALFQEVPLEILVLDDCSGEDIEGIVRSYGCLLYTSPSPRDRSLSRMPSSA